MFKKINKKNHEFRWTTPKASYLGGQVGGFTLIEMVVVVASLGIIVVALVGTILGIFRSQNTTKSKNRINESGRIIIAELRRNIFNSNNENIVCGTGKTDVSLINDFDGVGTTLVCSGGNIASQSGTLVRNLNNNEVTIFDCSNFAVCTMNSGFVSNVTFNFGIKATNGGVGISEVFNTVVTVRN